MHQPLGKYGIHYTWHVIAFCTIFSPLYAGIEVRWHFWLFFFISIFFFKIRISVSYVDSTSLKCIKWVQASLIIGLKVIKMAVWSKVLVDILKCPLFCTKICSQCAFALSIPWLEMAVPWEQNAVISASADCVWNTKWQCPVKRLGKPSLCVKIHYHSQRILAHRSLSTHQVLYSTLQYILILVNLLVLYLILNASLNLYSFFPYRLSDTSLSSVARSTGSALPDSNHDRTDHNTKPMEHWRIATVAWTGCYCMTSLLCRTIDKKCLIYWTSILDYFRNYMHTLKETCKSPKIWLTLFIGNF